MLNSDFWHGRRVFITGHTGFKGSWLSLWLKSMGAHVTGFSLPAPTIPNLFSEARIAECVDSIYGDIRDLSALQTALIKSKPEIVFHLAAQSLVRLSYHEPVSTYATNVMGTVHMLEAIRSCPTVRSAVMVTSDKCYENREWSWGYRESEAMGGYDPYSNSKGCAELVVSAYRNSFFNTHDKSNVNFGLATARAGNVIGGGDWAQDRLIPDFIRSMSSRNALVIRSPHAIRPWQHVLEPLSGYLLLAELLHDDATKFSDGWNFGPHDHDAKPVQWIVNELVNLWGDGAEWRLDDKIHPHEANYLKLDISKARMEMNWSPRWNLANTLNYLVDWYKAHRDGEDMHEFSLHQITKYVNTPSIS